MTVTDQIKILNRKIKQNEAQYDLDRKAAKISALSSNNLDKYEYLTGEDLGLKPSTVEQARFEYSPLSKFLNKGLKEEEKKEGPLKILKNIEGKDEQQLKAIKDQGNKQFNTIKNSINSKNLKVIHSSSKISPEAEKLMSEIKKEQSAIDSKKLIFMGANKNFLILEFLKVHMSLLRLFTIRVHIK